MNRTQRYLLHPGRIHCHCTCWQLAAHGSTFTDTLGTVPQKQSSPQSSALFLRITVMMPGAELQSFRAEEKSKGCGMASAVGL